MIFLLVKNRRLLNGSFVVGYLVWYGVSRFLLDFCEPPTARSLTRYLGLTPAQYVAVGLFLVGIYGARRLFNNAKRERQKR